jgi:hypothetical protein
LGDIARFAFKFPVATGAVLLFMPAHKEIIKKPCFSVKSRVSVIKILVLSLR